MNQPYRPGEDAPTQDASQPNVAVSILTNPATVAAVTGVVSYEVVEHLAEQVLTPTAEAQGVTPNEVGLVGAAIIALGSLGFTLGWRANDARDAGNKWASRAYRFGSFAAFTLCGNGVMLAPTAMIAEKTHADPRLGVAADIGLALTFGALNAAIVADY